MGGVAVPEQIKVYIEEGLKDGLMTGVLGRYPLADVRVKVTDVRFDAEASTDVALRTASVMALREAVMDANPEFMEPIMMVDVITPCDHMGDVLADLNGRRGKVIEMMTRGTTQILRVAVPLAEMFGYSTVIRSVSRGRANYTMEPKQFDIVPKAIREHLLNR